MICNNCKQLYGPTLLQCPNCESLDVGRAEIVDDKELARQKNLNYLQVRHGELTAQKKGLTKDIQLKYNEVGKLNKELKSIGQAIYDLKNINGDTPHITDHAVVRYLERVKGMDIWQIKAEIMQHKESVRIVNTIVTVNEGKDEVS